MISCFTSFAHLVEARSFYYSPAVRPFFTLFSVRHSDKPDTHPFPPIYYRTKRPAPCVSLVGRYQGPGAPLSTCQVALLALSTLDSHSISSYYSAYSTYSRYLRREAVAPLGEVSSPFSFLSLTASFFAWAQNPLQIIPFPPIASQPVCCFAGERRLYRTIWVSGWHVRKPATLATPSFLVFFLLLFS